MKTFSAKPGTVEQQWFVVDADGKTLGRMATAIASRLRGKHKPEFTPHVDTGDYIVVVNASKVRVTGNKTTDKLYHHHTGFPGGIRTTTFDKLRAKSPDSDATWESAGANWPCAPGSRTRPSHGSTRASRWTRPTCSASPPR